MNDFTVVGDLHIDHKNLDKAEVLFNLVEDLKMPAIWLGDILDTKEIIKGKCLNFVYDKLKDSKIDHIILVGNHDYFNLECEDHALRVLNELSNVHVVDKAQIIHGMCFVPYIDDKVKFKKQINIITIAKSQVIFMHQDVMGFDYSNERVSKDGVTLKSLKQFKRIISGHFHKFQQKDNLTFLGTAFTKTFGESGQLKYIGIYHKDTDVLELIETKFPKHVTIPIDCDTTMFVGNLDSLEDDYVRVILQGTQENINKFDKNSVPFEGIKWIENPSDSMMTDQDVNEAVDNITQFNHWAKDIKKIDPETIKIGVKILEALND